MLSAPETRYAVENNKLDPVLCTQCLTIDNATGISLHDSDEQNLTMLAGRETVTIAKETYDRLNLARQLCSVNVELSNETTAIDAAASTQKWLWGMTVEEQILFMRKMQAVAAETALILKRAKAKIEDVEKDMARKRGTELDRSIVATRKAEAAKIEKAAEQSLSPLERKRRREREKGIESLMTYSGLSREDAAKAFDRQQAINKLRANGLSATDAAAKVDSPDFGKLKVN